MRYLKTVLAAVVIAVGILAPGAVARDHPRCPPGTDNEEYCEHGHGHGHDPRHHHHHDQDHAHDR
jgi:hypothetical protein